MKESKVYETQYNSLRFSSKSMRFLEIPNQEDELTCNESDPNGPMIVFCREINMYLLCGWFDCLVTERVRHWWYIKPSDMFWSRFLIRRICSRFSWSKNETWWQDWNYWTKEKSLYDWIIEYLVLDFGTTKGEWNPAEAIPF